MLSDNCKSFADRVRKAFWGVDSVILSWGAIHIP